MVNTALSQNAPDDDPKMPRAGQADLNDLRYQRAGKISLEVVRELLPIKEIPHAWSATVFDHYLSAINAYAARDGYALPPVPVERLKNGAILVTAQNDPLLFSHLVTAIKRDTRYPQGAADQVLKQKMLSVDLKTYHEWVDLLQAQARYFHKNGSQYAARLGQMTGLLVAADVALDRPIIGAHPGHLGVSSSVSNGVQVSLRESNRALEIDHPLSPGDVVLVPYATFGTVGDLAKFARLKDFRVVIQCEDDFIYSVLDTACIELGLNHIQAVKSDLTEFFAHSKGLGMVLLSHGEAIGRDTLKKIAPLLADALKPGGSFVCYNGDDPANGFGSWQLKDEMHSVGLNTDVELGCRCSKTDFSANRHQHLLALDGLGISQAIQEHETKLETAPATLFRFVKE